MIIPHPLRHTPLLVHHEIQESWAFSFWHWQAQFFITANQTPIHPANHR